MATRTSTESEQTGNDAESTQNINIESSQKVNKNAVPRRTRLEPASESSDMKSELPNVTDNNQIHTQLSSPEQDGGTDSGISSDAVSVSSTIEEDILKQSCPITRGISDVSIDGSRSDIVPPSTDGTMPTSSQPSTSISVASSPSHDRMLDFVILHTDADTEATYEYMDHLLKDIGITDLTVDLFSNIDAGKSQLKSVASLHDNYRFIFIYVTENLKNDKYCKFLQEIIITTGLREANGKEDRVVPVLTQEKNSEIPEISVINGLQYFKYNSGSESMKTLYIKTVKKLVQVGRKRFP